MLPWPRYPVNSCYRTTDQLKFEVHNDNIKAGQSETKYGMYIDLEDSITNSGPRKCMLSRDRLLGSEESATNDNCKS